MALAFCLSAQTADEIVAKMDEVMEKGETQGLAMTMSMKVPIAGEFGTRIKTLGDLSRADADVKGEKLIIWNDKTTTWTYSSSKNEIVIENRKPSDNDESNLVKGVTSGYDVSIKSETDKAWTIKCVKSKSNKEKDDPKTMELVVSKKTYMPISLSTKIKIVTVTLKDFAIGVSAAEVKYDPSAFKDAKITDKR